jgi:hypothetical protein
MFQRLQRKKWRDTEEIGWRCETVVREERGDGKGST